MTSNVVFLAVQQERFDEPGLVALAAWITCDFSLMTKIDDFAESASSSSDEEVASDDEVVDESESESDTGSFVGVLGAGLVLFKSAFGGSICTSCKSADVIGRAWNEGSGRGCLAPAVSLFGTLFQIKIKLSRCCS